MKGTSIYDGYVVSVERLFVVWFGKGGDVAHAVCVDVFREHIFDGE